MIADIFKLIGTYVEEYGYPVIFLAMLLENSIFLGALVPGETIAFLAGFYASKGLLEWPVVIVLITLGAVLGDTGGFFLGRHKGKRWLDKIGKLFGYREEKIDRAQEFWSDYGPRAIFLGRFIAVARTFVPFLAGTSKRVQYKKFIRYDFAGAIIWAAIHVALGYFFGANYEYIHAFFGGIGTVLLIIGIIVVYQYLIKKGIKRIEDE